MDMDSYLSNVDPGDERPEGLVAIPEQLAKSVFLIGEVLRKLERLGIMREIERSSYRLERVSTPEQEERTDTITFHVR
jgi:hypothetical protein